MDLEINQNGTISTLSQFGVYNIEIQESSPELEIETRDVKGRSGLIFDRATFKKKIIEVRGRLKVPSLNAFYEKRDYLNGFLISELPYHITKMLPEDEELYDYELPGATEGDFSSRKKKHVPWKYYHEVLLSKEISFSFKGRFSGGLLYDLSLTFETVNLPYGKSKERNVSVSGGSIEYNGTALLSQLEVPFKFEFISDGNQNNFYFELNARRFQFNQATNLERNDKVVVSGHEVTLNGVNANEKTNYQYFELLPFGRNAYKTDFIGKIRIIGMLDLYK